MRTGIYFADAAEFSEQLLKCPACGSVAELQHYDVGLADEGCVFCNQCHEEFILPDELWESQ